jgi:succinate-semialdehyde dehydrogenase/glutarate-semialdehyde dehydrogenase
MMNLSNGGSPTRLAQLFIDGRWCDGAHHRFDDVLDPATEAVIGGVAHAEESDVDRAIDAASRAFPRWRATPLDERSTILRGAAAWLSARMDVAALALTSEQGKPLPESRAELARAIDTLLWHATHGRAACLPRVAADGSTIIRPEPLGVVAALTPWNYPAVIIARKLAAALIAGCTVVLKAAEATPTIATLIVAALAEAGLPSGVLNLLFGDPPAISARLIASPHLRGISFTGSTAVGKQLATRAGGALLRCVFELGGHAPALVYADADVDAAVRAIAAYKFECAGQSCNAPSRVYVHASVYERFVHAMANTARAMVVGDGREPATTMGPLSNARRLEAIERLTDDARAHGARVHVGGARLARHGFFFPPTVLTDVGEGAALLREEPFGPLLPVWSFENFETAVAHANSTAYGLAAYVFTRDQDIADEASAALEAGCVGVNELSGVPPDVGIAGVKDSGYGYEGGAPGIEAFLALKAVRGTAHQGDIA